MSNKQKIVLASGNKGKLREFSELFAPLAIEIIPQGELGVSDADETGLSFIENAILKARHAAAQTGLPALADDSGLAVHGLNGEPGIYSARYAGTDKSDTANIDKVLQQLKARGIENSAASFICVLALVRHASDPTPIISQGEWRGTILPEPRGQGGFGYDPIFWVAEEGLSAAELPAERKREISHRGKALQQLLPQLAQLYR